ncbi:hypothetical protein AB0O91_11800 [Kitasatospora sp. NPDC089797]|uniref:hypothetical protein n=1 Tax=Kitasatospora sp. NPDC089797 TaxID=3155298 RepID=UPI0034412983
MAWYQGPSRITVTAVEGEWPQRAVVTVRGAAPVEIPATVGAVHLVEADSWQLALEHRFGSEWCPNIRAVQGRWQEIRGVLTQLVHSRNRDRAGDRRDRNVVLRIERVEPDGGAPAAVPGLPAARRTTTTAGAGTGASARGTSGTAGLRTTTSTAGSEFLPPAAPARPVTSTGAARPTTSTGAARPATSTGAAPTTTGGSWRP